MSRETRDNKLIQRIKGAYLLYGYAMLLAWFLAIVYYFVKAFLDPVMRTRYFSVNQYGEAYPEMIMLFIAAPAIAYIFYDVIRNLFRRFTLET